jgi:hypothetical protein
MGNTSSASCISRVRAGQTRATLKLWRATGPQLTRGTTAPFLNLDTCTGLSTRPHTPHSSPRPHPPPFFCALDLFITRVIATDRMQTYTSLQQQHGDRVFAGRHRGAEFVPTISISRQPCCLLQRGSVSRARSERGRRQVRCNKPHWCEMVTLLSRDEAARWCGTVFRHCIFVTFYTGTRALQPGVGLRQQRL